MNAGTFTESFGSLVVGDVAYLEKLSLETCREQDLFPREPTICDKFLLVRDVYP